MVEGILYINETSPLQQKLLIPPRLYFFFLCFIQCLLTQRLLKNVVEFIIFFLFYVLRFCVIFRKAFPPLRLLNSFSLSFTTLPLPSLPLLLPASLPPFLFLPFFISCKSFTQRRHSRGKLTLPPAFCPSPCHARSSSRPNPSHSPISASRIQQIQSPQDSAEDAFTASPVTRGSAPSPPPPRPPRLPQSGAGEILSFPGLTQRVDTHYLVLLHLLHPISNLKTSRLLEMNIKYPINCPLELEGTCRNEFLRSSQREGHHPKTGKGQA